MKSILLLCLAAGFACAQQQQQPQPPLLDCGAQGKYEVLCGTQSPEDLELTPDGKDLIVSQFVRNGAGAGLTFFDPAKKTFTKIPITDEPLKDWGDASCPGPIGDKLGPHGISLLKRKDGKVELYVVNHGGRQSMEMYELKKSGGAWSLAWHGCEVTPQEFNDVAALPDGSFIATHPVALQTPGADLFAGKPSGYVSLWSPGKGEMELPGTRAGYPNGVLVSADGRYMYFNAWTAREVHKYDLKENQEIGMVKLDFMPDNITWTKDKKMLAAGVKSARGNCPPSSATPCVQTFGIAEIDPATMAAKTVFDSEGKGALIGGVSVALEDGKSIYVGAFSGNRLVKIPR